MIPIWIRVTVEAISVQDAIEKVKMACQILDNTKANLGIKWTSEEAEET